MSFELHPQLLADCYELGTINDNTLLLHKNALVPWFILVPNTRQTEFFKLEICQQQAIQAIINEIAHFIEHHFKPDKLNIATLGNLVHQLAYIDGFSVTVVFHHKAQHEGNGHSPWQVL